MGFLGGLFNGGASTAQKTNAAQQQSLANEFMADYGQLYGQQQGTLQQLRQAYAPLVAAGPGQQGFTSPVLNALNTQAINSSAAAARNARQSAGNFTAGQNNTSGLMSGITKQINASIDSSAANNLATAQNQITQANYKQGRDDYFSALGGMDALAGLESPNSAGSAAGNELNSSFGSATKINDEENAQKAAIAGGIASLGLDVATAGLGGFANLDTTGGSTAGEQLGNFFSGSMNGLAG